MYFPLHFSSGFSLIINAVLTLSKINRPQTSVSWSEPKICKRYRSNYLMAEETVARDFQPTYNWVLCTRTKAKDGKCLCYQQPAFQVRGIEELDFSKQDHPFAEARGGGVYEKVNSTH